MAESNKMQAVKNIFYRCNEGDFFKFLVCRNQCCLLGNLSGTGWRYGITGYFTFETACNHFTIGGNFFYICQKRSDGRCTDLVGISDHRSNFMPGRICIFKEDQKK